MKPFLRWCFVATALTLAGCSNTSWRKSEVLAVPLQPTLQQEVILARMEQILASRALTDDERAQLLYERGVLYDSLGLRALARNDFSQALAIRPDMPEVFNYLGIYLTQAGNFDAAYEAGADYASMGTWSVPKEHPAFGTGFEGSYLEPMTKYNFDRHEAWKEKGQMACICLGIDPGVVNVFAKYAAEYLFDELYEVHIKDGGNLTPPESEKNDILFGFNPWTVLDEVMNPNAEWDREKGFLIEDAFAGEEEFRMPEPFGMNRLVKVEHEEVVTLPRYLGQYGLRKASFKIALDENLLNALKVIDRLGLRSLRPVEVDGVRVIPRDVVAACAPKPQDIGADMTGGMCVGAHCIGVKDGKRREYFIYQPFDNEDALQKFGMQAVVAQTGFGAALGIELIARGIWRDTGVFSPEYFPSRPFMELMKETGLAYGIEER